MKHLNKLVGISPFSFQALRKYAVSSLILTVSVVLISSIAMDFEGPYSGLHEISLREAIDPRALLGHSEISFRLEQRRMFEWLKEYDIQTERETLEKAQTCLAEFDRAHEAYKRGDQEKFDEHRKIIEKLIEDQVTEDDMLSEFADTETYEKSRQYISKYQATVDLCEKLQKKIELEGHQAVSFEEIREAKRLVDELESYFLSDFLSDDIFSFWGLLWRILGLVFRSWHWILSINITFDVITIIVTIYCLKIVSSSGLVRGLAAMLFDIIIAVLLAIFCHFGVVITGSADNMGNNTIIAYCMTTCLPTIAFQAVLMGCLIARLLLFVTIRALMYFAEVATEKEAKEMIVFSILAALVNGFIVLLKTAAYFL
ncbi:MAG: hypothetical protein ACETWQ_10420 [Phycisphaerae bacterium]